MILPVEGCLLPGSFGAVRSGAVVLSADFRCNMICGTSLRMCGIVCSAVLRTRLLVCFNSSDSPSRSYTVSVSCPVLSRSVPFVCGFRTVSISVLFCPSPSPVLSLFCLVPVLSCSVVFLSRSILSYPILLLSRSVCPVLVLSCSCLVLFCPVPVLSCPVCSVPVLSCLFRLYRDLCCLLSVPCNRLLSECRDGVIAGPVAVSEKSGRTEKVRPPACFRICFCEKAPAQHNRAGPGKSPDATRRRCRCRPSAACPVRRRAPARTTRTSSCRSPIRT